MEKIRLSAFTYVPPFAQGLVRDLRVRWALEEAGLSYETRFLGQGAEDPSAEPYLKMQPFGQVPSYEEGDVQIFESGAIVFHVAEKTEKLLPTNPARRAKAISWMFAALNSVELTTAPLIIIDLFNKDAEWAKLRRPEQEKMVNTRLGLLSKSLGEKKYLDGDQFTAGDLLMVTVLRALRHTDLVERFPNLRAYAERCEARPAFQKALKDQMDVFEKHSPKN